MRHDLPAPRSQASQADTRLPPLTHAALAAAARSGDHLLPGSCNLPGDGSSLNGLSASAEMSASEARMLMRRPVCSLAT
jgi:hypothetical protein